MINQFLSFSTVSGGLSAELTGGNFWQGAATGLMVSGLNHVAHRIKYALTKDPDIPDLTKEFNKQLRKTRNYFAKLRKEFKQIKNSEVIKLERFIQEIETGSAYDLKNQKDGLFTKTKIPDGAYYNGELFRYDDFGNYNFGVAAKAYGYTLGFVQFGAGVYQIWSGTAKWKDFNHWFDDPQDAHMIEQGFKHKFD